MIVSGVCEIYTSLYNNCTACWLNVFCVGFVFCTEYYIFFMACETWIICQYLSFGEPRKKQVSITLCLHTMVNQNRNATNKIHQPAAIGSETHSEHEGREWNVFWSCFVWNRWMVKKAWWWKKFGRTICGTGIYGWKFFFFFLGFHSSVFKFFFVYFAVLTFSNLGDKKFKINKILTTMKYFDINFYVSC